MALFQVFSLILRPRTMLGLILTEALILECSEVLIHGPCLDTLLATAGDLILLPP